MRTERREWLVVAGVAAIVAIVHGAATDPRYLFCDDLGLFVALQRYTYAHPWDAWLGVPSPSFLFGSAVHDPDLPSVVPLIPALLAPFAPRDPYALGAFEWHVTSACVALAVAGAYAFARRFEVPRPIALATATLYPFFAAVSRDYHVAFALRGKLLLPLALAVTARAVATKRWRDAALVAIAWSLCLGHSALSFWMIEALGVTLFVLVLARGRSLRPQLPLVVAAIAVAAVILPPLLRLNRTMASSAWTEELATKGATQLHYLLVGRELTPARALAALNPIAAGGLALAAIRARRGAPMSLATRIALALVAAALPLFVLQHLPVAAFRAEADHVLLFGARLPRLLTTFGHVPERTWLVQIELAGTFAAITTLGAFARDAEPLRTKALEAAFAVALLGASSLLVGVGAEDVATSCALAAIVLALASHPRAMLALPALALVYVVPRWATMLEANARRGGRVEEAMTAQLALASALPADVQRHPEWRVGTYGVIRSVPLLLDSGATTCCGVRVLRKDVLGFFRDLGAVRRENLPYHLDLDWQRLDEQGVLPLFGIRWWVVDPSAAAGLPLFARPGAPVLGSLRLLEDARAMPKAWPLLAWTSSARAADLAALGARLRTEGIVDAEAGSVARATVDVRSFTGGELHVTTDADGPFVVATNELLGDGWTATIDGAPSAVVRTNAIFVGAKAPAGKHDLALRHRIR